MHDTVIVIGNPVPLQATGSSDIIRWSWSPGTYLDCANCASTISLPRKHIRYEVTGYNQYGCSATASTGIRLICAATPLFIPNTFTPNKDGRNDLFYPRGKGVQLVKFFRIYNRLGEMIFERRNFALNDPAQGWDGTYLGKSLTAGVFTYSSDMICDAGEIFSVKGTIMLIH
jgi:gliding motility-associated-like protein